MHTGMTTLRRMAGLAKFAHADAQRERGSAYRSMTDLALAYRIITCRKYSKDHLAVISAFAVMDAADKDLMRTGYMVDGPLMVGE